MTNKFLSVALTRTVETYGSPITVTPGEIITIVAKVKQENIQSGQISLNLKPEGHALLSNSTLQLDTAFDIKDYIWDIQISEEAPSTSGVTVTVSGDGLLQKAYVEVKVV